MIDLPQHIHEVLAKATCLYTKGQVETALDQMAEQINEKLVGSQSNFSVCGIGRHCAPGNLLPRLNFPLEIDYIHASRYHNDITGKNLVWKDVQLFHCRAAQ